MENTLLDKKSDEWEISGCHKKEINCCLFSEIFLKLRNMDCTDRSCFPSLGGISLALVNFPDFPPPPPLPAFMAPLLIFEKDNSTESCDLCSKWGFDSLQKTGGEVNNLTFMLTMVAIISALSGAGIMAAILSIRRYTKILIIYLPKHRVI